MLVPASSSPLRRLCNLFLRERDPLPEPAREPDATRRDYGQLASGLARVLAHCPSDLVQRHFRASADALRSLRRQFRKALGEVSLSPALLNDLAHEIAQVADAETRAAARRCLLRAAAAHRLHAALA